MVKMPKPNAIQSGCSSIGLDSTLQECPNNPPVPQNIFHVWCSGWYGNGDGHRNHCGGNNWCCKRTIYSRGQRKGCFIWIGETIPCNNMQYHICILHIYCHAKTNINLNLNLTQNKKKYCALSFFNHQSIIIEHNILTVLQQYRLVLFLVH